MVLFTKKPKNNQKKQTQAFIHFLQIVICNFFLFHFIENQELEKDVISMRLELEATENKKNSQLRAVEKTNKVIRQEKEDLHRVGVFWNQKFQRGEIWKLNSFSLQVSFDVLTKMADIS